LRTGLNYYKDEFNLKNSDGESVGSIEIEFQYVVLCALMCTLAALTHMRMICMGPLSRFEPKYMPWQHLMATRSIDDLPADYKSTAHVASTGSPAK